MKNLLKAAKFVSLSSISITEMEKIFYYRQLYKILFYVEHLIGEKWFGNFFKNSILWLNSKTENELKQKAYESSTSYEIVDFIDENLSQSSCPKVIKNGAKDWEAVNKWSLDYLSINYGDREISINNNIGLTDLKLNHGFQQMNLSEYIDEIKNGSLKYLKLSSLVNEEKALQAELNLDSLRKIKPKGSTGETFYTFIGGKGAVTPMHNEFPCNVYVQVYGKKKWILYPPKDFFLLNTHASRRPYFYTDANPIRPTSNEKNSLFKYAKGIEINLEPGDILWVPPFYWHYVENTTDSISVAYKFANISSSFKTSAFFSSLFFMATKPSPIFGAIMSRIKGADYVLEKKHTY